MWLVYIGLVFSVLATGALAQQIEYVPDLRSPDGRPQYGLTIPGPYGPITLIDPYRCQEVPKGCQHVIEHELGHARDLMRYGTTSEESANRQADWELGFGGGGRGFGPPGGWGGGGYWPPPPGGGWGYGSPGGWGGGGYWPPPPGGGWGHGPPGGWGGGWGGGGYWPPPPGGGWGRW